MRRSTQIALLGLLLISAGFDANATAADDSRDLDPRATAVLKAASDAHDAAKFLEYDFEFRGTHLNQGMARGHVQLQTGAERGDTRFLADVEIPLLPSNGALRTHPQHFRIVRDADGFTRWDLEEGRVLRAQRAAGLLGMSAGQFTAPQMFRTPAFGVEIEDPEYSRYVGTSHLDGVECDVVYLRFPDDSPLGEQYFYFGREDHLMRRGHQVMGAENGGGGSTYTWTFEVSNVRTGPPRAESDWTLELPDDLAVVDFDAALPVVGAEAPSWSLPKQGGARLASSDLSGRAQVLTFWATWCPFCRQAMPPLEEIRQDFESSKLPVDFVAIQIWDSADPTEFLSEVGWQGHSLVEGDEVASAFQATSTPTTIVVDRSGKITARLGGNADQEQIEKAIRDALDASE